MQKGGPLKFLTTTKFPVKIEFTCFSMGLTRNFHGKKGGPEIFLQSEGGGAQKIFTINYIFCISPPYKCL